MAVSAYPLRRLLLSLDLKLHGWVLLALKIWAWTCTSQTLVTQGWYVSLGAHHRRHLRGCELLDSCRSRVIRLRELMGANYLQLASVMNILLLY